MNLQLTKIEKEYLLSILDNLALCYESTVHAYYGKPEYSMVIQLLRKVKELK